MVLEPLVKSKYYLHLPLDYLFPQSAGRMHSLSWSPSFTTQRGSCHDNRKAAFKSVYSFQFDLRYIKEKFLCVLKTWMPSFLLSGIESELTQQSLIHLFTHSAKWMPMMYRALLNIWELAVGHRILHWQHVPLLMSHIIEIILGEIELCCHNLSWDKLGERRGHEGVVFLNCDLPLWLYCCKIVV